MALFSTESGDWETDKFQDKFIKDYYQASPVSDPSCPYSKNSSVNRRSQKRKFSAVTTEEIHDDYDQHDKITKQKKQKTTSNKRQISNLQGQSSKKLKNMAIAQTSHDLNFTSKANKKNKVRHLNEKQEIKCQKTALKEHMPQAKKKFGELTVKDCKTNPAEQPSRNKKRKKKLRNANDHKLSLSDESSLTHYNAHEEEESIEKNKGGSNSQSFLLRERMVKKIQAAKFRLLNEKMYTETGLSAMKLFRNDKDSFYAYHQGYQTQVNKWPVNPVDLIIKDLSQQSNDLIIADLGCGDAKIARTFPKSKIHSFDLVALNDLVTCCDISKVPLANDAVDIAVFCLSLMGTNLNDFIAEAHRILKFRGLLKIAEVESRFEDLPKFIKNIETHGFVLVNKDISHKMFVLLDFNKVKRSAKKRDLPTITLKPCLYKRR